MRDMIGQRAASKRGRLFFDQRLLQKSNFFNSEDHVTFSSNITDSSHPSNLIRYDERQLYRLMVQAEAAVVLVIVLIGFFL